MKYLKFVLYLALGLSTTVFYSCDKDNKDIDIGGNPSKITAIDVFNSTSQIVTAAASIHWHDADDKYYDDVIAQVPYKNNGFTLELPATLPAKYLISVAELQDDGFVISDNQAKLGEIELLAYNKDENPIGNLWLGADGNNLYNRSRVMWTYVDRNVSIKGENKRVSYNDEFIDTIDVNFKKGWNVIYGIGTEKYNSSTGITTYTWTVTTPKPSSINFYWYYEDWGL